MQEIKCIICITFNPKTT